MGARDEALKLLREGLSPGQIARQQNVTLRTIVGYLNELVGRGQLRRSDIFFSVPIERRRQVLSVLDEGHSRNLLAVMTRLRRRGLEVDEDDAEVVLRYGDARYALGDMYEDLQTIEVELHRLLQSSLEQEYGPGETGWWRKGIPLKIRQTCQTRREEDDEPAPEPYCYTDLIDLKEILNQKWAVLSRVLPHSAASNKQRLMNDLVRLNHIRRLVMHPVRGGSVSQEDFEFVHSLKQHLGFASLPPPDLSPKGKNGSPTDQSSEVLG
jgi:DNA-binding MarR family transcriptional regulator